MKNSVEFHSWNSEPEVGELLSALVNIHSCKEVLEIGVFKGASYLAMSKVTGYTGIDIEDLREEITRNTMEKKGHRFIKADSIKTLPNLHKRHYDLIFIDSIHEYDHCMAEFKICEELVKKGGLIVFHDSVKFQGVKQVIDYIKSFQHFDVITLNTPDIEGRGGASGISIVRCNYE